MKTLICCIGKNENQYIREYVEWYKNLGVTNICLYDNNDVDGEHFEDAISDYIESGYVIMNNWRGRKLCQSQSYQDCYDRYCDSYDWILFIDCGDEYLHLNRHDNIEKFLSSKCFEKFDLIHVNLMTFGDCGLVHNDKRPLHERFVTPVPLNKPVAYTFPENYHVSSIVRGHLAGLVKWEATPHTPCPCTLKCCNGSGFACDAESPFSPYDFSVAEFRHYTTKTAEEYCNKMERGFPDQICDRNRIQELIETRFFRTNEVTEEKIDVFKERLGIDMSFLLKKNNKSEDVKVYSLCYVKKDFNILDDKVITPLQVGAANGTDVCELKDNTGDNISFANFFYIENTGTYWIWKNVHGCKYKGQMQYRRPLAGIDETFDFDSTFKKYDVITCKPFNHPENSKPRRETNFVCIPAQTVEEGYKFSNCGKDIEILEEVIKESFTNYSESYDKYIKNGENLYYSSGYIMREADYDRYCLFLFDVLNAWLTKAGVTNQTDLYYYIGVCAGQGYLKQRMGNDPIHYPKNGIRWQTSVGGFLGERIWTLWLLHNFSRDRIYETPYIKMEEGMYT